MRTTVLTADVLILLRLFTSMSKPKLLRTGYCLTDWFKGTLTGPKDWARVAYDADGLDGIHQDYFHVAKVQYASESKAWRWQSHPSTGSRYGISSTEASRDIEPHLAMSRADLYLEYFSLHPNEMRNTIGNEHLTEPFEQSLYHPSCPWRLLSWHFRNGSDGRGNRTYDGLYFRTWVLTPLGISQLPVQCRTGLLVERAESDQAMGATVRVKGKSITWSASVAPNCEKGDAKTLKDAFHQVQRTLLFLGCMKEPNPSLP